MPTIRDGLYDLLTSVSFTTKELGKTRIKPWPSQRIIIDTISRGLSEGVHEYCILKPRQVAATSTCSVVQLFWALLHPGTQGAIIADSTANLERLRRIFADLLESLPVEWRGPDHRLVQNNRTGMVFANKSVIDLMAAGSNPDLGASRALNMGHFTECSLWRSLAGVESLRASLARENPHRLYIFESIANGVGNWFYDYVEECKQDTRHKRFIFLGFWSQPLYNLPESNPDYKIFMEPKKDGSVSLTDDELEWASIVKRQYNYAVKFSQIAWWRKESEYRAYDYMARNYPWHEEQCFISSGHGFFPARKTLQIAKGLEASLFKGYRYTFDEDFLHSRIDQVTDPEQVQLRVWEEPQPDAVYVIGVDPSGGGGGEADDHAIQVMRCYSDRIVQVAEYQSNYPLTYQLAWVLCHLCGAYPNHTCNLEVTGIGAAVIPETRNLRLLAERGFLQSLPGEPILDVIGCVKWYLYERVDSLSGPSSIIDWKSNSDNKAQIYTQVRDALMQNLLEIRSKRLLAQMNAIVQDQNWIGAAEESKHGDDLVMALCLAVHPWATRVRKGLIAAGTTWDSVHTKPVMDNPSLVLSEAYSRFMTGIWVNTQRPRERF